MPLHRATILALAALCLSATHAHTQQEEESAPPEVTDVRFEGVRSLSVRLLRESVATDESRCRSILLVPVCTFITSPHVMHKEYLDRTELARDIARIRVFYWLRGFRDTRVDTTVTPRGADDVRVTFTVTEGPPTVITRIAVLVPGDLLTQRQIGNLVPLRAGEPLDLTALDTAVVQLRNRLWDLGHGDAIVDTVMRVSAESRTAEVEIRVDPRWFTRVGRVQIVGNERVSDQTILNSMSLREGGMYRRTDLIRSQRNLYESALFQHVTIVVPPRGDSVKTVEVRVQEAPLQEVRLAAGFNTLNFIQTEARYRNYNWYGRARRLDLSANAGNLLARQLEGELFFQNLPVPEDMDAEPFLRPTWQLSTDLRQPWFGSPRNTIGASAFAHRRSAPGVYVDRGLGASASFTRDVVDRGPLTANYRYEVTSVEAGDLYFCINYGVCETGVIQVLRRHNTLSPLALTFNIDRTNAALSPTKGYSARGEVEHASALTLSDFRYNRAVTEGAVYRTTGGGLVLAAHARVGGLRAMENTLDALGISADEPIAHPRKRFFAGGSRSVRGFGENQLGPRILTISPSRLRGLTVQDGDTTYSRCPPEIDLRSCPLNGTLRDRDFLPHPLGGNSIAEVSVEMRFPIRGALYGAVFVDAGLVSLASLPDLGRGVGAITPGFGVRYHTAVGPIRLDVGINPYLAEDLPVFTQVEEDGFRRLVRVGTRTYAPLEGVRGVDAIFRRMVLHLSIGQAF